MSVSVFLHKPQDFRAKVGVVLCHVEINGKILFLFRSEEKEEGSCWCFPGGKIEPDETPLNAAIRELSEETGILIASEHVRFLGTLYARKFNNDYIYYLFQMILPEFPMIQLNAEHTEYRWVAAHEIETLQLIAGGI